MFILSGSIARAESYERVERRNMWNLGDNVTGILRDSLNVSYAELYYRGEQGQYRNFSDASTLWSSGVEAKTITHYDRVSMVGAFTYDHTEGQDMMGSMFISPNGYPFDLLEFTPGDKRLQTYSMMGGITSQLNQKWRIGVKGEFKSQNYVKYKDLRHYNYRMELALMPSVAYQVGDFTLGLTYKYARNSEIVKVKEVGSTAAAYYAFLDKGLMSGAYETWGGSGVHLNESGIDGFPTRENFNGGAFQIAWRDLYGEVEYMRGNGEVGEKSTYWFYFPSQSYTARVGYLKEMGDRVHIFQIEAQKSAVTNNENVLGDVTENGVTNTVIYGSNEIFTNEQLSITPRYEMIVFNGGNIALEANYTRSFSRSTLMYPYVDELTTNCYQLSLSGMLPIKRWELRASLLFSTGDISEGSYSVSDDINAGEKPTHLEEYYNIKNEYLTATTLSPTLSVRYNLPRSLYCEAGINYTRAFDLDYISGDYRAGYSFKIGYNF